MGKQITKGQIIEMSLDLLSEEDRKSIREDATVLVGEVWQRNRRGHGVPFGPIMALELLWALGRLLNEIDDGAM